MSVVASDPEGDPVTLTIKRSMAFYNPQLEQSLMGPRIFQRRSIAVTVTPSGPPNQERPLRNHQHPQFSPHKRNRGHHPKFPVEGQDG